MNKMSIFFIDDQSKSSFSYNQLISELNQMSNFNKYCYTDDFYKIFRNIIFSLINDQEIILLDYDFTKNELFDLTGLETFEDFNINSSLKKRITSKEELLKQIKTPKKNWRLTLYTSGTTGLPKKVSHTFESITRFVKQGISHNRDIWGFAYNPTHIAGVQVFLQALLNGNSIVRLFKINNNIIYSLIEEYNISHISASPTFYNLFYNKKLKNLNVKRVSVGGERFSDELRIKLKDIFPNAIITNIYASTEIGTLLAAGDEYFTIKSENFNLVKIIDNELYVNNSILGVEERDSCSYFATGDLVEIISEGPLKFKFIGRKNEMINVGGYKVNPIEVEDAIKSIRGIKEAIVFSKNNSVVGNIICCDIVLSNEEITEEDIRKILQGKLQEFKIPRIIKFVEQLNLTRTGKTKR